MEIDLVSIIVIVLVIIVIIAIFSGSNCSRRRHPRHEVEQTRKLRLKKRDYGNIKDKHGYHPRPNDELDRRGNDSRELRPSKQARKLKIKKRDYSMLNHHGINEPSNL